MSTISPITLPTPIDWNTVKPDAEKHIQDLKDVLNKNKNQLLYTSALSEVIAELRIPEREDQAKYWLPYLYQKSTLEEFFMEWLTFTPTPADPSLYIEYWDYLANTNSGLKLANDEAFKAWFRTFLNFHGDWINSTSSTLTLSAWKEYKGTKEHPFDINDYEQPDPKSPTGGFFSFNQFFLRNLQPGQRPLCTAKPEEDVVVAPCDGGIFFLNRGGEEMPHNGYDLPGKSDRFYLNEAVPGYGPYFEGGPLLDILLWFTDYHHFHAPVAGTILECGLYEGSYNYDFGDYNPKDHYAPDLPNESDRAGWYEKLGKHQRYVWIIQTENLGLVAMIAIGFWGVGSIINKVKKGDTLERGQFMGHFGYGGSSIVLAFAPDLNLQFKVGDTSVSNPDFPTLMKVRECLAKRTPPPTW